MTIPILNNLLILFYCASHCLSSLQMLHKTKCEERGVCNIVVCHWNNGKKGIEADLVPQYDLLSPHRVFRVGRDPQHEGLGADLNIISIQA